MLSSKNAIISLNIIIFLSYSRIQLFHPCLNSQYMLLSHSVICVLFTYFTEKLVAVKEEQLLFSTKPNISSPFIHICVLFTLETTYKIVSTPENNSITKVILLPSQGACSCVVSTVSCIIQFSVSSEDFNFTAIKSAEYLLSLKNLFFDFHISFQPPLFYSTSIFNKASQRFCLLSYFHTESESHSSVSASLWPHGL